MNNKITLDNPLRSRLTTVCVILLLIVAITLVGVFISNGVSKQTYNGQVKNIQGAVTSIDDGDDGLYIVFDDETQYNANALATVFDDYDFGTLIGQNVTLYIPLDQFGNGLPIALGVEINEQTILDYHVTIESISENLSITRAIFGALAGIFGVACCACFVWRGFTPATKEYDLTQKYAEYNMRRQPSCQQSKVLIRYNLIQLVLIALLAFTSTIVANLAVDSLVSIVLAYVLVTDILVYVVGVICILKWFYKKEREFYAKNLPFDLTDLSHVHMRKAFKEQLQAELIAERVAKPHRYGDGGNGYTVDFDETGIRLILELPCDDDDYPTAQDVFGEGGEQKTNEQFICKLDYNKLNFEAVPVLRKRDHPLTVVIKSRLEPSVELPDSLVNDLHIILDCYLLETLKHFAVPVENLDYVLDNKAQLMQDCAKRKVASTKK